MQIEAPNKIPHKIFLAGTIDMGNSENWQKKVADSFPDEIILNPRREDWDSSWEQKVDNKQFNEQVNWEMNAMKSADILIFNFLPDSKSPITIGELYFWLDKPKPIFICCPDEFYRSGNIHVMCQRYNRLYFKNIETVIDKTKSFIQNKML